MISQKHDCKTLHGIRCKLSYMYSLLYYVQDPGSRIHQPATKASPSTEEPMASSHSNPMQSACRHGSHMQMRTNASTHMLTLTDVRRAQSKVHTCTSNVWARGCNLKASPYVRHSFEDFQDVLVLHAQIHIHCNQQNFTEHRDRGQRSVTFPSARSAVYTCTNDLLPSNAKH